jgi:hypothetical protein
LNLAGPYPCIQGLSPFANDPYGYHWEHLDEWGHLGKFEWMYRTQLLPKNYPFLLHRAFIPLDIPQFNFDPHIHLLQARGSNPNLCSLAVAFLNEVCTAGMMMLCCIRCIDHVKARFHLVLPSDYDPDWHFRSSWSHLLQQGMTPAPAWKAAHIAQELRRWVLDATGYVTLTFRVILYLICFKECLRPPRFRTTMCLTGLIVSSHD